MKGSWWNDPDASHAFMLSWFSVMMTIAACIGGLVTASITGSSLILAYGLENMVDFLSSAVVLWRFYCPYQADPVREAILAKREKRAAVAISLILVLLGFGILITAIQHFVRGEDSDEEENQDPLIIVGGISISIFGSMTYIKFRYATLLSSPSLHKDGVCSLIGTILSASLLVNSIIIKNQGKAWWLDPLVALLCGLGALYVGLSSVYFDYVIQGVPVLSPRWWVSSQGEAQPPRPVFNEEEGNGSAKRSVELPVNKHQPKRKTSNMEDNEII